MTNIVLGIFSSGERAGDALFELETLGYNPKDMPLAMKDDTKVEEIAGKTGAGEVAVKAIEGILIGALLGGIAGLTAFFVLPGLGAFFIGEQIAAALGLAGAAAVTASGAVTGALAGAILGTLTSVLGLSNEETRIYKNSIGHGGILIAVPARQEQEVEIKRIMSNFEAKNIKTIQSSEEDIKPEDIKPGERYFEYPVAHFSEIRKRRKDR